MPDRCAIAASTCPLVVVDGALRVHCANAAARRALLRRPGVLRVHAGQLQALAPEAHARLHQRLHAALQVPASTTGVLLPRPGQLAMALQIAAVPNGIHDVGSERRLPLARIGWHDPHHVAVHSGLLQDLFGLTPAEATVAASLADGAGAAEIAQAQGIQVNTVQSHIKKALAKTGTQRQAQMVSLLLRCAAVRCEPSEPTTAVESPQPVLPATAGCLAHRGNDVGHTVLADCGCGRNGRSHQNDDNQGN